MNQINCPVCGTRCVKSGKTKAGAQRWLCRKCKSSLTRVIDNRSKELQLFLDWLFSKNSQSIMPGEGRTFRRKTAKYWDIWPMLSSGAISIRRIDSMINGISYQHVLSYNPYSTQRPLALLPPSTANRY